MNKNMLLLAVGAIAAYYLISNRPGTSSSAPINNWESSYHSIADIPEHTWVRDNLGYVGYRDTDENGIPFIGII